MQVFLPTTNYNENIISNLRKVFGNYTVHFLKILKKNSNRYFLMGELISHSFFNYDKEFSIIDIYIIPNKYYSPRYSEIENFLIRNLDVRVSNFSKINKKYIRETKYKLNNFEIDIHMIYNPNILDHFNSIKMTDFELMFFNGFELYYNEKFLKNIISINFKYLNGLNLYNTLIRIKELITAKCIIDNLYIFNEYIKGIVVVKNNIRFNYFLPLDINQLFSLKLDDLDEILYILKYTKHI